MYKTVNNKTGEFYYGKHSSKNIYDSYLGSGVLLVDAVKRYGKDNFTKEVLKVFSTDEEAYEYERFMIKEHIGNPLCYNKSTIAAGCPTGTAPKDKVISFRVDENVYRILTILSGGKVSEYMRHLTMTHTQDGLVIWGSGHITSEELENAGMSIPVQPIVPGFPTQPVPIPLEETPAMRIAESFSSSKLIQQNPGMKIELQLSGERPRRVNDLASEEAIDPHSLTTEEKGHGRTPTD